MSAMSRRPAMVDDAGL